MKKRFSALLSGILSVVMLGSVCAFAAENDGIDPQLNQLKQSLTKTVSFCGYNFDIYSVANYNSATCSATVWIEPNAVVPANTMSVQAYVLDENLNAIRQTDFITMDRANNYAVAQTNSGPIMPVCYFGGRVQLSDPEGQTYSPIVPGLRYANGTFSYVDSPKSRSTTAELPTNRQGQTYGTILDGDVQLPDLIAAVGVDGNVGYAKRQQFCPTFYTTQARERYNKQLEENNYLVPLYDLEGNQIDWFRLDHFEETTMDPLSQAHIQELSARNLPVAQDLGPLTGFQLNPNFVQEFGKGLINGDFPKNAKGETFGNAYNQYVAGYAPDYIACIGDNGEEGYMRYRDFSLSTASTVNLYDMDGNVVDQFTFD